MESKNSRYDSIPSFGRPNDESNKENEEEANTTTREDRQVADDPENWYLYP